MAVYIYAIDASPYLMHHGIKGQRWGVRRFQNLDGTYTNAGKMRLKNSKQRNTGIEEFKITKTNEIDQKVAPKMDPRITANIVQLSAYALIDGLTVNPAGLAYDAYYASKMGTNYINSKIKTKKMSELKSLAEVDAATGLKLKSNDTTEKFDLKHTNPGYGNLKQESYNNCALCSIAYDLRRRGYEVTAGKAGDGYTTSEIASVYKKPQVFRCTPDTKNPFMTGKNIGTQIKDHLRNDPEGSRGIFCIHYKNSGHAVAYQIERGKPVVYDAQNGKKSSIDRYFKDATGVDTFRTDNLEVDYNMAKRVVN